jgi:hypothetical protein
MCRMPPDGAAHNRRQGLLRRNCSRDAPGNCDEHAPNSSVPAADVRAVASFVCARAHRASAPLGRPADPGPSCVPLSRQGGTRGGRLTAGDRGRGEAHSLQGDSPSPVPARRFAAGACGRWAQQTQNGPPSVASRKYDPPVRCPARVPLGSPPPGHHPYLVQRDAMPKVGEVAASWRVAVGRSGRGGPLTPSGRARTAAAGPHSRLPADPANVSAPAHTASGSHHASSGGRGPSAASTTQP